MYNIYLLFFVALMASFIYMYKKNNDASSKTWFVLSGSVLSLILYISYLLFNKSSWYLSFVMIILFIWLVVGIIAFGILVSKDKEYSRKWSNKTKLAFVLMLLSVTTFTLIPADAPSSTSSNEQQSNTSSNDVKQLNNWYKNKFDEEQVAEYKKSGQDYHSSKEFVMASALKGFKVSTGNLKAIIDYKQMKAENLTDNDVSSFAFNVVISDYKGNTKSFDNFNSDGSLKDEVMKNHSMYSEVQ